MERDYVIERTAFNQLLPVSLRDKGFEASDDLGSI